METLDYGAISFTKGNHAGYLPQDGLTLSGNSIFAECMSVFADLREMEQELETLHHQLGELDPESPEYTTVADRLHHIDSEFRNRDGYAIEAQVGTVLDGLGFRKEDWTRRTEEFSGGWQMRIALAKLLLAKPNMLLLDEPTNHLDLEARRLARIVSRRLSVRRRTDLPRSILPDVTVKSHRRNLEQEGPLYSATRAISRAKEERRAQLSRPTAPARAHRTAKGVHQSLRAQATKSQAGAIAHQRTRKIERVEVPPDERTIHFCSSAQAERRIVAEFKDVSKSYGAKHVFSASELYHRARRPHRSRRNHGAASRP